MTTCAGRQGSWAESPAAPTRLSCRYGLIPSEGLLPRLEEGMSLFYAGLSAMSAAQSKGLQEAVSYTHLTLPTKA